MTHNEQGFVSAVALVAQKPIEKQKMPGCTKVQLLTSSHSSTKHHVVCSWRVKLDVMNTEKVYLVGVHRYCFRAGEKCEIVGVEYVQPSDDADYRLAYKVKYDDDVIDWVAFTDIEAGNWEFVSQLEAGFGMLPGVSR